MGKDTLQPDELEEAVLAFLADDGPVARRMGGFSPRSQQLEMARAAARALASKDGRLVVEAGTGTGKSLAYLAAAVLSELTVIVSTGTKALQDQLIHKDLPLILDAAEEVLGVPKRAALMKGRSNYLCLLRYERFQAQPRFLFKEDGQTWPQLEAWADTTETGDRAEIEGLPDAYSPWSDFDAGAETCVGQKCAQYDRCWVTRMRRRAQEADIIVANHHLLCADARVRLEGMPAGGEAAADGGEEGASSSHGAVLPEADALIVDEAHALPDVATDYFGVQLMSSRTERLISDVKTFGDRFDATKRLPLHGAAERAQEALAQVFDACAPMAEGGERTRLHAPPEGAIESAQAARECFGLLTQRLDGTVDDDEEAELSLTAADARALVRRSDQLCAELDFLLGGALTDPRFVAFVEPRRRGVAVCATPIDVASALAQTLFKDARPLVLTSATLAVEGETAAFRERTGVLDDGRPLESLVLPSPFDHARRAALFAPADMPAATEPTFFDRFCNEVRFLTELTAGGALLLFTSHRVLERAYETLAPELLAQGHVVLRQGEAPRAQLLDTMRAEDGDRGAVLFATLSFWEGVDIPGRALRLVVMDRLPFRSPADPVQQARGELAKTRGRHPFMDLAVPEAALALKQGAGRLLRTVDDAGIVAVLDGRLRGKRYGKVFLRTLPAMTRVGSHKPLGAFWSRFCAPALGLPAGDEAPGAATDEATDEPDDSPDEADA